MERIIVTHNSIVSQSCAVRCSGSLRLQSAIIINRGQWGGGIGGSGCEVENCLLCAPLASTAQAVRNTILIGGAHVGRLDNVLVTGSVHSHHSCNLRFSTVCQGVHLVGGPNVLRDCIVESVSSTTPNTRIEHCDVFGDPPFVDFAKAGEGCFKVRPHFIDPKNFDYRLMPSSPCIGKASDGGDVGVRYTPEMIEILKVALDLRARGIIKF